ncbi:unnamed protein product [Paramecium octaurelia]|uniref:Uncharacterized protein n=1 Tax=Paramecium octaurelia TaxID=43137 RepID=A0A8S1V6Y3_PAROT|nr:unnamed protein product [Paramecium octaurelia]
MQNFLKLRKINQKLQNFYYIERRFNQSKQLTLFQIPHLMYDQKTLINNVNQISENSKQTNMCLKISIELE